MHGISEVAAFTLGLFFVPVQTPATPPNATAPAPKLGCQGPGYGEFDFWIGEWNVLGAGKVAGTNKITRDYDGCVIREEWVGVRGMTGSSFSIYDPIRKRWHQTWIDNTGTLLTIDGSFREGAMTLEGPGTSPSGPSLNRITWRPLSGGRLRQVWEVSPDSGKTWEVIFDGTYESRQGAPSSQSGAAQADNKVEGCTSKEQGDPLAFWIGEWNVYLDNEQVGINRVERVLGGCAVMEHWRDRTGHEGKSFFYYSPAESTWKQVWVTDTAWQRTGRKEKKLVETLPGGGVKFQGQLLAAGATIQDRTTLTPLPDGRLRQVIEQSPDGKTWKPSVDLIHIRAKVSQ